jgi:hypothetical protein
MNECNEFCPTSPPPPQSFSIKKKFWKKRKKSFLLLLKLVPMTDKEYQTLLDAATKFSKERVGKEEARRQLIECGVLDKDGHWVVPEAAPYLLGIKSIGELRRRD